MTVSQSNAKSLSLTLSLGVLGAALLILSAMYLTPGKYILVPYVVIVFAVAAILRMNAVATFRERFVTAFGAFMLATLALYVVIAFTAASESSISVLGHAWRIGLLTAIGVAVNGAVARVTAPA